MTILRRACAMAVLFMGGMFSTWGQAPAAKAELPTIAYFHHSYSVYTIDPKVADIRLYWKDASGHLLQNFTALNAQVESEGNQLLFAANAGMFQPDFSPVGLLVINGQEISPLNLRDAAGNFYLKPNGVFVVTDQGKAEIMESSSYATFLPRVLWATQSGPLIVHHGEIHPDLIAGSTNLAIRSGVGVREDGTVVMALSKTQVNFYDFASFFRDRMKCPNALYLDGTISAFCLPGQVQRPALHLFGPMIGVVARK